MIRFSLNGKEVTWDGDPEMTLLTWLREEAGILSVKDGCSGQAACGACMVEIDGRAKLSCVQKIKNLAGCSVVTLEGYNHTLRDTLSRAFVAAGAVQCGFCTPGMLVSTKVLLDGNIHPTEQQIRHALKRNICRCTGYQKVVSAVQLTAQALAEKQQPAFPRTGGIGKRNPKYDGIKRALGTSPFVDDLRLPDMLHGALLFSQYPRARVLQVDTRDALAVPGVVRIVDADDIPGERHIGLIINDWPLYVKPGEVTRYVGDVLLMVVAASEQVARNALQKIAVEYEVLDPLTDMEQAEDSEIRVHDTGNLLDHCVIRRGDRIDDVFAESRWTATGRFSTQRIEHAFLETETALAEPYEGGGVHVYSQSQGVYEDQRQIARILNLPLEKVRVTLVPNGGGFGGKEDLTVQGHAALAARLLKQPVKIHLTRSESLRMHPKRHPMNMDFTIGCDETGKLTGLKARILGDTGAYASVGMKVLERAAGHATGAYHVPHVDIEARAVYTNNVPCGAMRGFGVNQVTFALESLVEELCEQGGFDRWQFRWDNALVEGLQTATGQVLQGGVGVRATLKAVKDKFRRHRYAGIACGIKNSGIGNGMVDDSEVKLVIESNGRVTVHHGWTEMGQGVHTVAQQALTEITGIDAEQIDVRVDTEFAARAGMTTASRATTLLGNAVINAAGKLKTALETQTLADLSGHEYKGYWKCDWTTVPGTPGKSITHYSYSYATQVVVLSDKGEIETIIAAHDAGRIINPTLFEGQIEGSVHMGLGYALSEDFAMTDGFPDTTRFNRLGIIPIEKMPKVEVIGVEVHDPVGPWGAKGVGEIGLVPTAAAVANALYQYDGRRRYHLPMNKEHQI